MPPGSFWPRPDLAAAGFATTFVGPAQDAGGGESAGSPSLARLACVAALPQAELAALMRGARLIIANGGSTLLQAIACGARLRGRPDCGRSARAHPRAAWPPASPSRRRLDAADLEAKARSFSSDEPARAALARRAAALELADGVEVALDALAQLSSDAS